jgi:hypothetical protein
LWVILTMPISLNFQPEWSFDSEQQARLDWARLKDFFDETATDAGEQKRCLWPGLKAEIVLYEC